MVLREVDVEDVDRFGVAERAEGRDVGEVVQEIDLAVEAEAVEGLETPFARRRGEVGRGVGRGPRAQEARLDSAAAQLDAEIERRLGRPGPRPVPEDVQDAPRWRT